MNARPGRFVAALCAPGVGIVNGAGFADRLSASVALEDRRANGEAFDGEFVARVPVRVFCGGGWHRLKPWGRA